ncbi:MAG TPA: type II secretion system protein [Chthoniobacterales bacterium]|nr:type II secretion system protein [Chthoniobacterales bacterium]
MKLATKNQGYTLIELGIVSTMFSTVGVALCSLLNVSLVMGAKNIAMNTAHTQARTAMIQMLQDLHSSVSLPYLVDTNGARNSDQTQPAAGIAFQELSSGPHKITADVTTSQNQVSLSLTPVNGSIPTVAAGQRLIIPTHQIEDDITAVSGSGSHITVTLAHTVPVAISGTSNYTIVALITDHCSYTVSNGNLQWQGSSAKKSFAVLGGDITSTLPFSTPQTPAGALYYRFVSAINLSTTDATYSNRNFKAANIFLNGQIPMKARLTTYQ